MTNINSSSFIINVNRSTAGELGTNGRVQSTIVVYKGSQRLSPVSSTPTTGQFKVTISSQDGCSASIKENDTVYVNSMSSTNATITLNINVENAVNFQKNINLVKSISNEEISNIESRVSVAEQKITEDAITNIVSKSFYTKDQTNTQISSQVSTVQQTVDSWGVRISQNETDISSLKLTSEEFEVAIGGKADSSNIVSMINASTERIKISSSKIDITGFVTFNDLAVSGATTINGSNITTGTINGNYANITNINASNITTGTLSGNYIKGGTIEGSLLRTTTLTSYGGVSIEKDAIQLGISTTLHYADSRFKIETDANTSYSSMKNIYIMAGLNQDGSVSGTGKVYVYTDLIVEGKITATGGVTATFG